MSEGNTVGRLTKAERDLARIAEENERTLGEMESNRQRSAAHEKRLTELEKGQAASGRWTLGQLGSMVGTAATVAGAIAGLVMFAISKSVSTVEAKVQALAETRGEMTRLDERTDDQGERIARLESFHENTPKE